MNGKTGEILRWLMTLSVGAVVSYYAAQLVIERRIAVLETQMTERWNYVQGSLDRIEKRQERSDSDIRRIVQDWARGYDRRTGEPLPLQRSVER